MSFQGYLLWTILLISSLSAEFVCDPSTDFCSSDWALEDGYCSTAGSGKCANYVFGGDVYCRSTKGGNVCLGATVSGNAVCEGRACKVSTIAGNARCLSTSTGFDACYKAKIEGNGRFIGIANYLSGEYAQITGSATCNDFGCNSAKIGGDAQCEGKNACNPAEDDSNTFTQIGGNAICQGDSEEEDACFDATISGSATCYDFGCASAKIGGNARCIGKNACQAAEIEGNGRFEGEENYFAGQDATITGSATCNDYGCISAKIDGDAQCRGQSACYGATVLGDIYCYEGLDVCGGAKYGGKCYGPFCWKAQSLWE